MRYIFLSSVPYSYSGFKTGLSKRKIKKKKKIETRSVKGTKLGVEKKKKKSDISFSRWTEWFKTSWMTLIPTNTFTKHFSTRQSHIDLWLVVKWRPVLISYPRTSAGPKAQGSTTPTLTTHTRERNYKGESGTRGVGPLNFHQLNLCIYPDETLGMQRTKDKRIVET